MRMASCHKSSIYFVMMSPEATLRQTLCFFPEAGGLSLALLESVLFPEEEEVQVGIELEEVDDGERREQRHERTRKVEEELQRQACRGRQRREQRVQRGVMRPKV